MLDTGVSAGRATRTRFPLGDTSSNRCATMRPPVGLVFHHRTIWKVAPLSQSEFVTTPHYGIRCSEPVRLGKRCHIAFPNAGAASCLSNAVHLLAQAVRPHVGPHFVDVGHAIGSAAFFSDGTPSV